MPIPLRSRPRARQLAFAGQLALASQLAIAIACALSAAHASAQAPAPASAQTTTPATPYLFRDATLPTEQRIDNILSLMTVSEKIAALSTNSSVARLGIPSFGGSEGIHGVVQRGDAEKNRPAITTTQFPQPPGMGASWNPALVRQAAEVEGTEGRYITENRQYLRPSLMLWGPQADLARDPRWGRSEEVYSEDPFLAGTMATAFTQGLQGDDKRYWRSAALLKHFLANSNENGRGNSSSDFDERLFHEYYAVPFRMSFEHGARALMASYNAWNGTPMGVHPVLRSLVIDQWQAEVVSGDGGAVANLVKLYKRYPDKKEAVVAALKAGINQYLDTFQPELQQAVTEGLVKEAELDEALRRKLRVTIRLGLIDPPEGNPYATIKDGPAPWLSAKHQAVSLQMALESIVLLKNAGPALPLAKAQIKSIAVIGPLADSVRWDWYGGTPPYASTPLAGIRAAAGAGVTINYAADNAGDAAIKAARASDVAIVVVGNDPTCGPNMAHDWTDAGTKPCADPGDGREGRDRETLALQQEELVKQVLAANPRTVMVLVSSFPYTINWSQDHVPAIVQLTHSSQDEGKALASVLFGDYNPGGHTVSTWPASMDQLPPMMDYDIRKGRTYMYAKGQPLYPFGHGLSYTTFNYSKLRTSKPTLSAGAALDVAVDVTNTGKRAGDTVVQLYVNHPASKVARPRRALAGFQRINIKPGATRTVHIPLAAAQLAYWKVGTRAMALEAGTVNLEIGASSADIRLTGSVTVK